MRKFHKNPMPNQNLREKHEYDKRILKKLRIKIQNLGDTTTEKRNLTYKTN